MQTKSIINAVGGGTTLFSIGSLAIRKLVSVFGDAQSARDMIDIVQGTQINWPLIFWFAAVIGICVLIANNWELFFAGIYMWVSRNAREWDCPAEEAINYIATKTQFGRTLPTNRKLEFAATALVEAARERNILTGGRKAGSATVKFIKPHVWRDYKHTWSIGHDAFGLEVLHSFGVVENDGQWIYQGIMVDRDELRKLWVQI